MDTAIRPAAGTNFPLPSADLDSLGFRSDFEAYSAELQQIAQVSRHTLIFGARYQDGNTQTATKENLGDGRGKSRNGRQSATFCARRSVVGANRCW